MSAAPDVLIRADASLKMGTGHIFRDLVIAGWLRAAGLRVAFASRALPGNLIGRIAQSGFPVYELSGSLDDSWLGTSFDHECAAMATLYQSFDPPPSWVIADHYALDATWERFVASLGSSVAAIDDLRIGPTTCAC